MGRYQEYKPRQSELRMVAVIEKQDAEIKQLRARLDYIMGFLERELPATAHAIKQKLGTHQIATLEMVIDHSGS